MLDILSIKEEITLRSFSSQALSYGWLHLYCQKENKKALKTSTRKPMVHVVCMEKLVLTNYPFIFYSSCFIKSEA